MSEPRRTSEQKKRGPRGARSSGAELSLEEQRRPEMRTERTGREEWW